MFGGGTMESYYEVIQYEGRTKIGVLIGGRTIAEFKTKAQAREYCRKMGIKAEE